MANDGMGPEDIDALITKISNFTCLYAPEQILALAQTIASAHPDDYTVLWKLGRLLIKTASPVQAKAYIESALKLAPADTSDSACLQKDYAEILRALADEMGKAADGFLDLAIGKFASLVQDRPDEAALQLQYAQALDARGARDAARAAYREAQRLAPEKEGAALRGLAKLAKDAGDLEESAQLLLSALKKPGLSWQSRIDLLDDLAMVQKQRQDWNGLIEACLQSVRINPFKPAAEQDISLALAHQDWFAKVWPAPKSEGMGVVDPSFRARLDGFSDSPPPGKRVYFVTFAFGDPYEKLQGPLNNSALQNGASHIVPWGRRQIEDTGFFRDYRTFFELRRGAGYWIWKPFIILQMLLAAQDGDIVWYMDSDSQIEPEVDSYLAWADSVNGGIYPGKYRSDLKNAHWTKRDCFILMNCDEEKYWNHGQTPSGRHFWRKNDLSLRIVSEWLAYMLDPRLSTDYPNICGQPNLPGFIGHRHDQSVYVNLLLKNGLHSFGSPGDPMADLK